jgi:hypothetical protein
LKNDRHVRGYGKTTGSGKFLALCSQFSCPSRGTRYGNYLQDHSSAQYFDGIATNADIGNAFPFPRCSHMHFAWATAFDALQNHHLLVTICDAVLHHPAGSTARCRSGGWVFTAVKKHSRSSFEAAFAPVWTEKVEKIRA